MSFRFKEEKMLLIQMCHTYFITLPSLAPLTSEQAAGDTEASLATHPESCGSHELQIKSSASL